MKKYIVLLCSAVLLSACSGWWGRSGKEEVRLSGDRIAVAQSRPDVEISPYSLIEIELPAPHNSTMWLQPGGNAQGNAGHLTLGQDLNRAWARDIGASNDDGQFNMAQPVVAANGIFTMDAQGTVMATRVSTGKEVWSVDLAVEEEEGIIVNGGLALGQRRLFVATGFGEVVALNPANGHILWRIEAPGPIRSAPAYSNGRVFVVTMDNQVMALDARKGEKIWDFQGVNEVTGLLGDAGPVISDDVVIVPFSTGELHAFKVDTGRLLWVDSLAIRKRISDQLSQISDITSRPVVDEGHLYAVSHGGRLGAFKASNGRRIWSRNIGGTQSPAIAGDYLFIVDVNMRVFCLNKTDGRALWASQLPAYEDPEDTKDPLFWAGPVLAGNSVILVGSNGELVFLRPSDGQITKKIEISGHFFIPPVVANQTLFVLNDSADLTALR